ncbi:cytochrome P450 [Punctularia strigosozonata HHB-11173 SS5]|uniref:cytochrome P450 n=1 Tax=Punctularia strigosozonata (strain HHB-11173) TaxID=741275 RepID=UPI0004417A77|nr:cytochrome P450 [Punctularia strigosozonata HHB-11173 SS5]EIN06167.1 cytochrome P450 [Punctularia strigosozonata HHB-11173 SS5]
MPPGPRGFPLLGNALHIPAINPWLTFMEWGKQYGSDIIHLTAPGARIIVVNSIDVAVDLFDKRSTVYSDRPYLPMLCELVGLANWNIGFMSYGDHWRNIRRMFHRYLGPQEAKMLRPTTIRHTNNLLNKLLSQPEKFLDHVRTVPGEMILEVAYGIKVTGADDPWLRLAEEGNDSAIAAATPGRFLVDLLPFLKWVPAWVPGAGFKRLAMEWRQLNTDMYTLPYEMLEGSATSSVAQTMLSNVDVTDVPEYDEYLMKVRDSTRFITICTNNVNSCSSIIAVLKTFFLAMVIYPDAQELAHKELDSVLQGERLPDFHDMLSLPYTMALVKEVQRWHPVLPLGVARRTTQDDVYGDYLIPKGSMVLPNVWAMSRDTKDYPDDPDSFNPARFLGASGQLDPSVRDPDYAFGFGRRICAGRHMASDSIWIMMASILATFKISRRKEDVGVSLERYTSAFIV